MKALIAIMTCNRIDELKKNIVPYLQFIAKNSYFDFVVSLDGSNKEYIDFCKESNIPLIYSEEREGIGISRNRVVQTFRNYDYYFFIDDDVELIDDSIFEYSIELSKKYNINHFSPVHTVGKLETLKITNDKINCTKYGGGYFLMYSKLALEKVGGWHETFAKYKRFGHTEHTYRVYKNELNKHPFMFSKKMNQMILLNTPPSVSSSAKTKYEYKNNLILEESEMVKNDFIFSPFQTISNYSFLKTRISSQKELSLHSRYSFIPKEEQKHAFANYYYHLWKYKRNPKYLLYSLKSKKTIIAIKHSIKIYLLTILINSGLIKR